MTGGCAPPDGSLAASTEAFKRRSDAQRGKAASFADTSDPERARLNHIGRDLIIAAHVRRRASALGLTVVEIDGMRPLARIVAVAEAHVARRLAAAPATADDG